MATKLDAPMVRTSERSSFKRCRWAWDRGFNDLLKPIDERPALKFGTLIHKALELRYPPGIKRGPKPAATFAKLYDEHVKETEIEFGFKDEDDEWADARDVGIDMMEHFIKVYGRDEEWKVLASEQTFQIPVYDPNEPECSMCQGTGYSKKTPKSTAKRKCRSCGGRGSQAPPLFYYVGTMDGVWQNRMDGGIRIIDWKTTKNDPTDVSHLALDEQATAYWTWGCDHLEREGILKPKQFEALDGMLYTFMRKSIRDDRPRNSDGHYLNKDGAVSKNQPSPYFHRELVYRSEMDRERARERVLQEFQDMADIRAGERAAYKAPHFINCKMCAFRDICELHEIGADWEGLRDGTMKKWEPYAAHEIQEEGK